MNRNKNGKFAKALVKVGDIAVCSIEGFNPGFTLNKPYKVVLTSRCKNNSVYLTFGQYFGTRDSVALTKPNEFAVIDDDGICRKQSLITEEHSSLWRVESAKCFGEWIILP